ncbi:hypothetical protein HYT05_04310 [Candidatus Kaiserbacteria bacterium]|nr:hypothetical protein [Candidatus Kaiserbacteria bacterium]
MAILVWGGPALVGFVIGYFFALPVLIVVTVICVIIGSIMAKELTEMASMITMIFVAEATIGNVAMWITYYVVTKQTWIGDFSMGFLLR